MMEMVPMMTQTQDAAPLVPVTAAAVTALSPQSRISATPVHFAALFQEMLPPTPDGAESSRVAEIPDMPVMAGIQITTGKTALSGKGKAGIGSPSAPPEPDNGIKEGVSLDPAGIRLAQLLSMVVQLPAVQSPPQAGAGLAAGHEVETHQEVRNNSSVTSGDKTAVPDDASLSAGGGQVCCTDADGQSFGASLAGTLTTPELMPEKTGGPRSAVVQVNVETLVPATGKKPNDMVSQGETPVEPEKTVAPGKAPETNSVLIRSRTTDTGGTGNLTPRQSCQTVEPHTGKAGAMPPNQTEEPPRLPVAENKTNGAVSQSEMPAEPIVSPANQARAVANYAAFSGVGPVAQEGREAALLHDAVTGAGSLANIQLEVVCTDPSAWGRSFEGNEKSESGAKEKKQGSPGPGAVAARIFDLSDSNRLAPQSKPVEPKNALHESILSQVKESVVSHDGKGNGTITLKLNPVDLGDLQINVRIENRQIKVEVMTDNRTVRDALLGNLDNLKETFLKQNLNMERFDVSSGGGNGFGQGFRDERGDQRHISSLPFGHEAVPFEIAQENGADDWGVTDNSLVNLRL